MARTHRADQHKRWYAKESNVARRFTNRTWRHQGKRLLEDAPPQRGTQGWLTH